MEKQSDQKLMLRCIAWSVLKNIWAAVAIAVSISFFAYIGAKIQYTPSYTSSTTFVVSAAHGISSAYTNMTQTNNMLTTFRTIVNSQLMYKRVSEDLGVAQAPGTISVQNVPETNLVTLSVTAGDPQTAFRMLESVIRVYPEVGEKVLGEVIMEVFEQPEIPNHPDRAFQGGHVMKLAFLAGFAVVAAGMAAYFYLRDTVKTAEQAKKKLDTPLFATIYHEKQYRNLWALLKYQRKSMLMNDPAVSFLYEETLKKISTKLLYKLRSDHAKVVLVTSTVPGEGKSTVAMNLAQDLSRRGRRVLLIDGNLIEPGLAKTLHLENQKNIPSWGGYLRRNQNPTEAISRSGRYGFFMLLNSHSLPQATDLLTASALPAWMAEWKREMDVILIDAPCVLKRSDTEAWARYADLSLLVVRQDMAEAKYINDSIDMLEQYGSGVAGCIYNDAIKERDFSSYGYGYGYGSYGSYGHYGHYGQYGRYGSYGKYGKYGKDPVSDGEKIPRPEEAWEEDKGVEA